MTFAVIKTGGKQYLVEEGQTLIVERLEHDGKTISFDEVLLVSQEGGVQVGQPLVKGASVKASVVEDGKGRQEDRLPLQSQDPLKEEEGSPPAIHQGEDRIDFRQVTKSPRKGLVACYDRASRACLRVSSSAYSIWVPLESPRARRVMRTAGTVVNISRI
jgi:ribosomal protein L21